MNSPGFSEENLKQNEYPLYYKNCTFTVHEVACLLSGYIPTSIDGKWNYVSWLKENPKFEEALDFVWSAVRGDVFDEINSDFFIIESEKLKAFLATREFFIDGFNEHLRPLDKDNAKESDNLTLDNLEKENEILKSQLLDKDKLINEMKKNQSIHPSLDPTHSRHAPELLMAIEAWEEKYLENKYPYHEHTPAIELILKDKGMENGRLIQRISAITNPKKKI